jgi:hypothetical protein
MIQSTPTVPVGTDGLEGWTSCCEAAVTYHGITLICKKCYMPVAMLDIEGDRGDVLSQIVRDVIDGTITADEGVARQRALLAEAAR